MICRVLITLGLALFPTTLWCAPQSYSTQEQIAQALAPLFAPYVRQFNRPVYLFHGTKNKWIPTPVYLGAQAAKAWDQKYSGSDAAGGGLYLATEPATSRAYGNTIYALKTIPEKFRFLDLSASGLSFPYSARQIAPEILRASIKLNCKFWLSTSEFAGPRCLAFRKTLFKTLGVTAHFYKYGRAKTKHPEEKYNTFSGAFVASSLQGLDYRSSLESSDQEKSFNGLLKTESAASIENFQTRFYLGLNPKFSSERTFGNHGKISAEELQKLKDEIDSAKSLTELDKHFENAPISLHIFKNREKIFKLLGLSPSQLREVWLSKIAEIAKTIDWDETSDPNGEKFTAYSSVKKWDTSFVKSSDARGFSALELYDEEGNPHAIKLSQKCVNFIENYLTSVTDKSFDQFKASELRSAARKIIKAKNPQIEISNLSADSENYKLIDKINAILDAPACAVARERFEKLSGESQDDDFFTIKIYHRPSEPSQRKRRFFEILEVLKAPLPTTSSSEKALNGYRTQIFRHIMEFSLLDPAKTTADTKKLAGELLDSFKDSTLNYESDEFQFHYDLRSLRGAEYLYVSIKENRDLVLSKLREISWIAFKLKHFPNGII